MSNPRELPKGVQQGTYRIRPVNEGTIEIDVREFVGWWDTDQNNFVKQVRAADPDVIRLSIASEGGFVSDALAIHDFLKRHRARVEVEISGLTASAATIIAMAGDEIRMSDNALFLIHHASALAWGKAEELESAASGLHKVNGRLLNIYAKKTGRTEREIDVLMSEEEWLTADETLAWGFIDSIFEPDPAEALAAVAHMRGSRTIRALGLPPVPWQRERQIADSQRRKIMQEAIRKM